jgi:TonB family protein
MDSYINYISESGISLGILTLIYIVFLRKETFFNVNRTYLIVSSLFSALLPLLSFSIIEGVGLGNSIVAGSQAIPTVLGTVIVGGENLAGGIENVMLSINYVGLIYLAGVLFMTLRFGWRFGQLWMLVRSGEKRKLFGITIIRLGFSTSPFSFFSWLFVGKDFRFDCEQGTKILKHELVHIRQQHTIDVLLFEILTIFQWFNPFIWFLRLVIRENHEFIADSVVTGKGISIPNYKTALLQQVAGVKLSVANNFNYSMLKTRFKMISKLRSPKISLLKYLSGAVAMSILIVVFACETQVLNTDIDDNISLWKYESGALIILDGDIISNDEANSLDPDSIGAITIVKGGKSMDALMKMYGEENTKNGVVNIISKSKTRINKAPRVTDDGEEIFFMVEDMPEFPGGDMALRKYIAQTVRYPIEAKNKGIEGKVFVTFVVGKDGKVGSTKVVRGVDPLLDNEADRVVKSLPSWKPGRQMGKAVNVSYTVPINFALSSSGQKKSITSTVFSISIKNGGEEVIIVNNKEVNVNEVAALFDEFYNRLPEEKRESVFVGISMVKKPGCGSILDRINKQLVDKEVSITSIRLID